MNKFTHEQHVIRLVELINFHLLNLNDIYYLTKDALTGEPIENFVFRTGRKL